MKDQAFIMARNVTILHVILQLLIILGSECDGLRVLLVPTAIRSHTFELAAVGEKLLSKGHNVSIILADSFPFASDYAEKGLDVISFTMIPSADTFRRTGNVMDAVFYTPESGDLVAEDIFELGDKDAVRSMDITVRIVLRDCQTMLQDNNLARSIEQKDFDIAIVDAFSLGYCSFLIPYVHKIPFTASYSGGITHLTYRIPGLPSFTPFPFGNFGFTTRMTFTQRLLNTWVTLLSEFNPPNPDLKNHTLLHKYAPEVPTWGHLLRMSELFFIHRKPPLDYPDVSMPDVIRTHGVTIREGRALPAEITHAIGAYKQVVIVSFGSVISKIPDYIMQKFREAFKTFPKLYFIIRVAEKHLTHARQDMMPRNARLFPWLPQQDLLADPRTVLFISHGGNNGQWEAVHHRVPMVCMPLFAEQTLNCLRSAEKNFSLTLDVHSFTSGQLADAIRSLTSDPRFSHALSRASRVIRESPFRTEDVISDWLIHVLHHGSEHLRSAAQDLSVLEFLMFDVLFFTFIIAVFGVSAIIIIVKFFVRLFVNRIKWKND